MISITDKAKCSGCTACFSICGKSAITMKPDVMGFMYPVVDMDKCVNCGLCEKVCAFSDNYKTPDNFDKPKPFAARQLNIQEIEKSRSGGVFAALSDWVLDEGGVVYGAGFDKSFRVLHKRADTKDGRDEFRGSKYVQSYMGDIFCQVAKDLKNGLKVLFSGTPCQTAGLLSFIALKRINGVNLFVCDIVCHGVPGPNIWDDYLKYIEKKKKKKITGVNFRDKLRFGWRSHRESFQLDNTYVYIPAYTFYRHIMFRHSCGECHYTNLRRTADITLADFWGWEKIDNEINKDDKGVSLILVNTLKGEKLFSEIKDKLWLISTTIDKCIQPNLQHPSTVHPLRMKFEETYSRLGFEKTMRKYGLMGWRFYLKRELHYMNGVLRRMSHRIWRLIGD